MMTRNNKNGAARGAAPFFIVRNVEACLDITKNI
jgi:hypothetical protein